ncbi:hypothetical protein L6452_26593 [Arctium lappa]|uniref:Uncharacterized protein n=1 Tax=Arctium lappa TaxID=4217 RepID=A0ACB8ZTZ6_ARCLA|nr:hypothetical protein L6452_26593 [Arctium lappa]
MAGLPRSDVSFRRSGSSGLVWDDKLLSGELKPKDDEVEREKREQRRSDPKPCRSLKVAPTIDPPSPKVSGCAGICAMFAKNTTTSTQKPTRTGHRKS